jgi:hypothetical protein
MTTVLRLIAGMAGAGLPRDTDDRPLDGLVRLEVLPQDGTEVRAQLSRERRGELDLPPR